MPVIPGLIFYPSYWLFFLFFSGLSHVKFLRHACICQPMRGNQRQLWILDSAPWILDSVYWIPDLSVDVDSRFQLSVRCRIPMWSCIPDWKAQDSGFQKQKTSKIPDTTCKNFPDSFTCGEYMRPTSWACAFWYHQLCYILNTGLSIIIWVTGWMQTILVRKAKWTSTLSWKGIQCTESKMP